MNSNNGRVVPHVSSEGVESTTHSPDLSEVFTLVNGVIDVCTALAQPGETTLECIERLVVTTMLDRCGNVQREAARRLRCSPRVMNYLSQKYGKSKGRGRARNLFIRKEKRMHKGAVPRRRQLVEFAP